MSVGDSHRESPVDGFLVGFFCKKKKLVIPELSSPSAVSVQSNLLFHCLKIIVPHNCNLKVMYVRN